MWIIFLSIRWKRELSSLHIFVNVLGGHFHDNFITKGEESKGQGQAAFLTRTSSGSYLPWAGVISQNHSTAFKSLSISMVSFSVVMCPCNVLSSFLLKQELPFTRHVRIKQAFLAMLNNKVLVHKASAELPSWLLVASHDHNWALLLHTDSLWIMGFSSPHFWELQKCWPQWLIVQIGCTRSLS